ncbi:MAG TPA: hypothetical protein VGF70_07410 [Solirubrobacteraceae bacterium]
MPYIPAGRRRAVAILAAAVAAMALPAAASAAPNPPPPPDWIAATLGTTTYVPPTCTDPTLTQPFQSFGDQNYYVLAPGESPSNFAGDGWTLLAGANITTSTLSDGTTGSVLDLPGGSMAISPPMCVASNYPTARTMVRNVQGGGGVHVFVTYAGTSTWSKAKDGGSCHGKGNAWGLSDNVKLSPANTDGWQIVRFALVPDNGNNDHQAYNFYVDPYAKR